VGFYENTLKAENLSEWDTMRVEGEEGFQRLLAYRK
jgi:hypothetical protein